MAAIGRVLCGMGMKRGTALVAAVAVGVGVGAGGGGSQEIPGLIAFERTSRDGSAVYVATPDGQRQRRVTAPRQQSFEPTWSPGSQLAFVRNLRAFELYSIGADGTGLQLISRSTSARALPQWSPDGELIAYVSGIPGRGDIQFVNVQTHETRTAQRHRADDTSPSWSPDGDSLVFASNRGGPYKLYVSRDGGEPQQLTEGDGNDLDPAYSPDGTRVAFTRQDGEGNYDIWTVAVDGSDEQRLTDEWTQEFDPTWSPDGRYIAFVTDRDSHGALNYEIYVMTAEGDNPTNITRSAGLDLAPDWSQSEVQVPLSAVRLPAAALLTCSDGTAGPDTLNGSNSSETICGKGGNDRIAGNGGNDQIFAGAGRDTVNGGPGRDVIVGEGGADAMSGGSGADTFYARDSQVDTLAGGPGSPGAALDRVAVRDPGDPVTGVP